MSSTPAFYVQSRSYMSEPVPQGAPQPILFQVSHSHLERGSSDLFGSYMLNLGHLAQERGAFPESRGEMSFVQRAELLEALAASRRGEDLQLRCTRGSAFGEGRCLEIWETWGNLRET